VGMARNAGRARKAGKARKARKEVRRDERDSERKMKNFEELDIWRQGCQLAVDIYQVTEKKDHFSRILV